MRTSHLTTYTVCTPGIARPVRIDCVIRRGLPGFQILGIRTSVAREMTDRIQSAILASNIKFPYLNVLVEVQCNEPVMEPCHLDLPIAVCIMNAMNIYVPIPGSIYCGKLNLTGKVQATDRVLIPLFSKASASNMRVFSPEPADQTILNNLQLTLLPVSQLSDIFSPPSPEPRALNAVHTEVNRQDRHDQVYSCMQNLQISAQAIDAISAAAAGMHPLLLLGPPGTGKTTLAECLYALLPEPTNEQRLQIRSIHETTERPVRRPHHSATPISLTGGGNPPSIGEIARANCGILLLDELGEFSRSALQSLREPLETGQITITRSHYQFQYPSRFWFVATSNPCPCGKSSATGRSCICTAVAKNSYRNRIIGPLLDRLDLILYLDIENSNPISRADCKKMIDRVSQANFMQLERYKHSQMNYNYELSSRDLDNYARFDSEETLNKWKSINGISRRNQTGIRRLARTFADLSGAARIRLVDLNKALSFQFRSEML